MPDGAELTSPIGPLSARATAREVLRSGRLELAIQIQVEELPEGVFLATSDELPGIARGVACKLIEARREREGAPNLPTQANGATIRLLSPHKWGVSRGR